MKSVPAAGDTGKPGDSRAIIALKALILAAAVLLVYFPALHGDWADDDNLYLADNPLRSDPHHLWKTWFQPGSFIEYYPLTETVQIIQWHFFGRDTVGYVLTNVVLHTFNALLLWVLLRKIGLRYAWLGGLLFAVHPANVESVAWISELKNTLSQGPFLLALCAWVDFEERGRRRDYGLALGLFLVAMLCKISMSPFPVFILLYAWWKRQRIGWGDVAVCAPFLLISLALIAMTQSAGVQFAARYPQPNIPIPVGDIASRVALAGTSGAFYFWKVLWPWPVSPAYRQWVVSPPRVWQYTPWLVLALALIPCWRARRTWGRHVLLGLGYFMIFLGPFVGLTKISYMTFTWVMDHFLYLTMPGLIALAVAGMAMLAQRIPGKLQPSVPCAAVSIVILLTFLSRTYAGIYARQESLYRYALGMNPNGRQAHDLLGWALLKEGKLPEAMEQFHASLKLDPNDPRAVNEHFGLGMACLQAHRLPEARDEFEAAIKSDPRDTSAYENLGVTLSEMGDAEGGIREMRNAVARPDAPAQAHNDLGNALVQAGQVNEGIAELRQAVDLAPDAAQVHDNLGIGLVKLGRLAEAAGEFRAALHLDSNDEVAKEALTEIHFGTGADQ